MKDVVSTAMVCGKQMELPLPGLHDVLTAQFNLTIHRRSATGKFVASIREPQAQMELLRAHHNTDDWCAVASDAVGSFYEVTRSLGYLVGLTNGVWPLNP